MVAQLTIMSLLDSIKEESISEFCKDLKIAIQVSVEIDKQYGEAEVECERNLKKFEPFVKDFNKKYKGIFLKFCLENGKYWLHLFLRVTDLKKIFLEAAVHIDRLKSGGDDTFDTLKLQNQAKLMVELNKVKKKMYLAYEAYKHNNVLLKYDEKKKMVELCYSRESILDNESPEFMIACFYAIKHGFNERIDLQKYLPKFVFHSVDKLSYEFESWGDYH